MLTIGNYNASPEFKSTTLNFHKKQDNPSQIPWM
uniref:Uncharacterized protein n=1 Tax=Rhizophora mucronata TaxID=61149 RepID=A0A2P2PSH5_RHIMU